MFTTYEDEIKRELELNPRKRFLIWYTGSRDQAEYIHTYSRYLKGNSILLPLPDSAIKSSSPVLGKKLLEYFFLDFPDIIVTDRDTVNKYPIIGIEILEQKPVGWNHTQRFARAAASAIKGVPFAYLTPQKRYLFDKDKSEKGPYKIGNEFYKEALRNEYQLSFSLYKLTTTHNIPCLPFFWPIEDNLKFISEGLIYNDSKELRWRQLPPGPINQKGEVYNEIKDFFEFIDLCIGYYLSSKIFRNSMDEALVKKHLKKIDPKYTTLYDKHHVALKIPDGGNIKIARREKTPDFIASLKKYGGLYSSNMFHFNELLKSKTFITVMSREDTIIVDVDSDPTKGNRGFSDPYSGVVASFDYRYCREKRYSESIDKRDLNLIFLCLHIKATKFFENMLKREFAQDNLAKYFPMIKVEWSSREKVDDTLNITRRLKAANQPSLKKEIRNFFYFCDLIIFTDNLFVGYMHT